MLNRRSSVLLAPFLFLFLACSSSAQAPKDAESLRKEIDALKAQQAEMQKSLDEIREFLRAATGGRFGAPSLVNSTFDLSGAPTNGQQSAPLTIVEISDYHCPFCRRHVQQTQPKLYSEYVRTGKARHVFIHYPIAQLHPDAHRSHEAASCAADQGKFWEYHLKLFEAPAKTPEQLAELAQSAGLDTTAFRACLDSGKYTDAVKQSVERIQQLNISGTPMFLIGKTPSDAEPMTVAKVIEGAQPFEAFKTALDEVAGK
ncbi:MAG: DsbA family protein [Vicinamibacterales bacterium]